jgi:predicted metalloprotease
VRLLTVLLLLTLFVGASLFAGPATVASATPAFGDNDEDDEEYEDFDEDGDSLDEFVDEIEEAANAFWQAVFKEAGKPYRAPKLVKAAADERIRSKCGNSRGAEHSYCSYDETVFLDWDSDSDTSFVTLWEDERAFVIVTTMGHEWGHHVQHLLGVFDIDERSVEVENQADCLMGVFANAYEKSSDWVTRADLKDALEDTRESGDDPDTPTDERTHGTPEQRVEAFRRGYQTKSLAACGL